MPTNGAQEVQLIVTLNTVNGQVSVSGPIQNKILCYGLLEAAKDAVRDYVAKNQNRITLATPVPPVRL